MISPTTMITGIALDEDVEAPGVSDKLRDRLEWCWGLGHNHLDDHLAAFTDPAFHQILSDDALLVIPHGGLINALARHNSGGMRYGVRRPHIQKAYKGRTTFDYLVIPMDSSDTTPAYMLVSEIPPHMALATTQGKLFRTWGDFAGKKRADLQHSLIERSKVATPDGRAAFSLHDLKVMQNIQMGWTFMDTVPQTFLDADSDQTMVEPEERVKRKLPSASGMDWEVGSSASCVHEPKRRLLPSELQQDFQTRYGVPGDDDHDEDDASSSDSRISGIEDAVDAGVAADEEDRLWMKGIASWAAGATRADAAETLLNDAQIKDDPRERPRVASSLDLARPDYLSRRTSRTAA
ncbi:hypothetical protein C8R46DRAFT_1059122 [Mycena filopes]|nr:hypothetical protein C8R46DRAFT_1059122 [Mycena filopes]